MGVPGVPTLTWPVRSPPACSTSAIRPGGVSCHLPGQLDSDNLADVGAHAAVRDVGIAVPYRHSCRHRQTIAGDDRARAVLVNADQCTRRVTGQQAVVRDLQHVERIVRAEGDVNDVRRPAQKDLGRLAGLDPVDVRAADQERESVSWPTYNAPSGPRVTVVGTACIGMSGPPNGFGTSRFGNTASVEISPW